MLLVEKVGTTLLSRVGLEKNELQNFIINEYF